MNLRKLSQIILISTISLLILWDLVAVYFGGDDSTLTDVIIPITYKYPFVCFIAGFVCGHLFWRANKTKNIEEIDAKHIN